MVGNGSYFVSKFKSSMCRTHYHADRRTIMGHSVTTPGPGSYRMPSDFGYYESKKRLVTSQSHKLLRNSSAGILGDTQRNK